MEETGRSTLIALALAVVAGLFVWLTSAGLPDRVASHFGPAGAADGFMPRTGYALLMAGLVAVLPFLLAVLPNLLFRASGVRINLPNRDYWMDPQRKEETIDFLCRHNSRFGYLLTLFLCYVHWLVVVANRATPPHLPNAQFIGGLVFFLLLVGAWTAMLLRRFRKVPDNTRRPTRRS